ncbi:MAG: 1,4-alpha-glucan branching protein GlgB [Chlamydiae bacterium]|nr:1,4-alpha-glucan branching protein GlgB [Chlamydiota bacterium]
MLNVSSEENLAEIFKKNLHNPHSILGLHSDDRGSVIRLYRPGATSIFLEVLGQMQEATRLQDSDIFEYHTQAPLQASDYRIYHQSGDLALDPYSFLPTFGEIDAHLFSKGVHYKLHEIMGARICVHQGVLGVKFAVWAPAAQRVALVGDFNHWNGNLCPMRSMGGCGVWELFVPGLKIGEKYKFEILTSSGHTRLKSDPFALTAEFRPKTASMIAEVDSYIWNDDPWMATKNTSLNIPMNIYEVHLGSWKKQGRDFKGYREMAHQLADYCTEMGFSHVELMPIAEHPLDESWGYQVTGPFATTSRFGTPSDFQYFVDHLHQRGIGVILDWVAAHFPVDDFSLAQFDGSYLYEHEDPRKGFHPHWNTYIFNYGRREVSNYLIANALFWLDKMHIDGLRVDAVASMIYLDYGRKDGEWIPNSFGGKENLEAIEFLKHLNSVVHERFPSAIMIAEESTAYPGVTHSLLSGGLGFDIKWNMGWMNDTLKYFGTDPIYRKYHQNNVTFGLIYAFSEKFALVLSHDEVVHGKASLLSKMPGDVWQKFANIRLLYSYMMCQPGKKLLFMGGEIGQWTEWYCKEEIPWHLLEYPPHKGLQNMVKQLNHFYRKHGALWQRDFSFTGFDWIDFSDVDNCVVSYLRKGSEEILVCIHNFTPSFFSEYFISLPNIQEIQEIFNTDREEYGGSGKLNREIPLKIEDGKPLGFYIQLPPLSTLILNVKFL